MWWLGDNFRSPFWPGIMLWKTDCTGRFVHSVLLLAPPALADMEKGLHVEQGRKKLCSTHIAYGSETPHSHRCCWQHRCLAPQVSSETFSPKVHT